MPSVTMQVHEVYQPKSERGPGSIKLADGSYMKVWKKAKGGGAELWMFMAGKTYDIEYDSEEYQGKEQRTARKAKEVGGGNGIKPAPGKPQNFVKPDTSVTDAERIFVCGALNNAIHAGQVNVMNPSDVIAAGRHLREAFRVIFLNPQYAADINDQINH